MSRTYKVHTHKAHCDTHVEARNKGKKSRCRSEVRAALKDIHDLSEADDFYCAPMKCYTSPKSSSGYLYPEDMVEKSYFKEIISVKKSLINGCDGYGGTSFLSSFWKLIMNSIIQKDSSFSGIERRVPKANFGLDKNLEQNSYYKNIQAFYWKKGLLELSDKELKSLIHKYVASKGG